MTAGENSDQGVAKSSPPEPMQLVEREGGIPKKKTQITRQQYREDNIRAMQYRRSLDYPIKKKNT